MLSVAEEIHFQDRSKMGEKIDLEACSIISNDSSLASTRHRKKTGLSVIMIIILGSGTAAAFMAMGINSAKKDKEDQFTRSALDLINKIEGAWEEYVTAAAWIHGRCRNGKFDRVDFREMYEYLVFNGLDFQAAQFTPNISHNERDEAEAEARAFYEEHYSNLSYRGFVGFNFENSTIVEPRLNTSYYFPIRKCFRKCSCL